MTTTPEWTLLHVVTLLGFTLLTAIIFSIAIYFARQFDKEPIDFDNEENLGL